jgi:hypothetical protein
LIKPLHLASLRRAHQLPATGQALSMQYEVDPASRQCLQWIAFTAQVP